RNVFDQARRDDAARVHRERSDAVLRVALVELDGEQNVGRLGLTVANPALVWATLEIGVFEMKGREAVRPRGDANDPRAIRSTQGGEKSDGQLKMAEMIRREVRLVAPLVSLKRRGHDAGSIDQDVKRAIRREKAISK